MTLNYTIYRLDWRKRRKNILLWWNSKIRPKASDTVFILFFYSASASASVFFLSLFFIAPLNAR